MTEGSWEPTPGQRVKILTDQTNALLNLVQRLTKAADKDAERITELEEINQLLCRDLDEAQRSIEKLQGISV